MVSVGRQGMVEAPNQVKVKGGSLVDTMGI